MIGHADSRRHGPLTPASSVAARPVNVGLGLWMSAKLPRSLRSLRSDFLGYGVSLVRLVIALRYLG
jgi:hypothetical protein